MILSDKKVGLYMNTFSLQIYKQSFKFSAAHFLIFDEKRAERLHGHNYQVQLKMSFSDADPGIQTKGFCIDFNEIKKWLKTRVDRWDEMVLLPAKNPEFQFTNKPPSLEVQFRDRFYVFPQSEVVLLDITNTSVELLAKILASECLAHFAPKGALSVEIRVEETPGQGASYKLNI